MMSLDNTLWLAYILTEVAVIGLLIYRRVWQILPVFCIYFAWDLLSNGGGFLSQRFFPEGYNPTTYFIQTAIDSVLQFGVLVELTWSVLRPIRASLPRYTLIAVGLLILAIGGAIWPFSALPGLAETSAAGRLIGHFQQTASILRVLFFLVLAGCSQMLSIGFRDRELQVATGLGFYSLVSLGAAMLSSHQGTVAQYKHLNQLVVVSFLCSLVYWIFSFAHKQTERREFTPQMQNLLLAVAGAARSERSAITDASGSSGQRRRKL